MLKMVDGLSENTMGHRMFVHKPSVTSGFSPTN